MMSYPWKARNLRMRACMRLPLLVLLIFGLPSLRSAVGHWPRTFMIDERQSFSTRAPAEAPRTASSPVRQSHGPIYSAEAHGVITSVTIAYLRRVLQLAEAADANVLIIQMSPTGGVLRDMRPFAGEIANAHVPVVVYVAPEGTQAGAAGALFLSAAHINALAPHTSFGSPDPLAQVDAVLSQQTRDLVLDSVADQLRSWNAAHGRNTDWANRAVREGVVLTNEQAIAAHPPAIDLVAADRDEL